MIWDNSEDIIRRDCAPDKYAIQRVLNDCRELRSPYVIITPSMREIDELHQILVPVSRLEEETYKGEICTYLARKTGAHILLLTAKDYGSRAKQNTDRIITHIQSVMDRTGVTIHYDVLTGMKDSDHINREACDRSSELQADLLLLTASREYGLDDLLFGPVERHVIQRALIPVMLVNPRADLYSLCD